MREGRKKPESSGGKALEVKSPPPMCVPEIHQPLCTGWHGREKFLSSSVNFFFFFFETLSALDCFALAVLIDVSGIAHTEFVPPGQMVNQSFYREVVKRLPHDLPNKLSRLWQNGGGPRRSRFYSSVLICERKIA